MNVNLVGVPVPVTNPGALTSISNSGSAAPAVVTKAAHGLAANTPFVLTTTGTLPAPLVAGVEYYVAAAPNANDFGISIFPGGPAISTSSAGAGSHSLFAEICRINVSDTLRLGITVKNTGAGAMTQFTMFGAMKFAQQFAKQDQQNQVGDITDVAIATLAADYSTPVFPVLKAIGAPVTLAAGASVTIWLDVSALACVSIRALATGGTTAAIEAIFKNP